MAEIKVGDMVIHKRTRVVGTVKKQYYPTTCPQYTLIDTMDSREYYAPTTEWRHYDFSCMAASCTESAAMGAAAPLAVKHSYRDIKVADGMTITIDLEDFKKEIARELYKDLDICRGLHYGA